MTASGHPRTIFQRAIERGNLMVAETVLRTEIPRPTLIDLLDLTALIAQKDPGGRFSRVAPRWLLRYLETVDDATVEQAAFVTASVQALGGRNRHYALEALRGVVHEASRRRSGHGSAT